jgi:hypothetical protein
MYRAHHGEILAEAAVLADAGKLKPLLSSETVSIERLEEAYALVGSGSLGKVVVEIRSAQKARIPPVQLA